MIVDSHCHLDFPPFAEDRAALIQRAKWGGVKTMLTISTEVQRFDAVRAIAESDPDIWCSIGTHPLHANVEPDVPLETYLELSTHPKCVAIGEAGLDFFYKRVEPERADQVFRKQIHAARLTGLPLVIHARDADEVMIKTLEDEMGKGAFTAVLHCFSSGRRLAEAGVKLGLYVSFSGILTYKKSDELRAIAADLPFERLLVETDAPYLAPQSVRGQRNEPFYVTETLEVLAGVKQTTRSVLEEITTDNFFRLFSKAKRPEAV